MRTSFVALLLFLLVLLPATVPDRFPAQAAPPADVTVQNFPETQQIKGDVQVTNFPALQQVTGSVLIEGRTKFIRQEGVVVHTAQRADLTEMAYAGTIETDGFTSMLISLQGEVRTGAFSSGTVGVLLVPDEKPILRVLRDAKRLQFPIECAVQVKAGGPVYFESEQVQKRVAFSRYHIYLYNTSNKSVEANIYVYLSSERS